MSIRLKAIVILALSLIFLTGCTSARQRQELQRGKNNFEAGYYRDAFRQLLPLATEGNKEAEYAVGYLYYYGYGVPLDTESGLFWIRKAAEQHYPPALQALGAIQKTDQR